MTHSTSRAKSLSIVLIIFKEKHRFHINVIEENKYCSSHQSEKEQVESLFNFDAFLLCYVKRIKFAIFFARAQEGRSHAIEAAKERRELLNETLLSYAVISDIARGRAEGRSPPQNGFAGLLCVVLCNIEAHGNILKDRLRMELTDNTKK